MSRLEPGQVPCLRADVRYRLVDGQAVVIVQDAGEALVLNEVGSRILEQVDGQRRVEEIAARLGAEFDAPDAEIQRDVEEYLGELVEAGVLEAAADLDPPA